MRWALLALGLFVAYALWMLWKVRRDNRPPPRWPGDP
jgi:cbb3-type cytochrome oxidase subunit 3